MNVERASDERLEFESQRIRRELHVQAGDVAVPVDDADHQLHKQRQRRKRRDTTSSLPVVFHSLEIEEIADEVVQPRLPCQRWLRVAAAAAGILLGVGIVLVWPWMHTLWLQDQGTVQLSSMQKSVSVHPQSSSPQSTSTSPLVWPPSDPAASRTPLPPPSLPALPVPSLPSLPSLPVPLLPHLPQLPPPSAPLPAPSSPPPPFPSSPPLSLDAVVEILNRRFEIGRPSNNMETAGIVVRMIDHLTDTEDWENAPWLPSKNPRLADRFSGSLINRRAPAIFMGKGGRGLPGFIISPAAAQASLMCDFTHDAGTVRAQCDPPGLSATCSPGCMGASAMTRGVSHWCDSPRPCHGLEADCQRESGGRYSYPTCPWPAEKLGEVMEIHEAELQGARCECCHWSDGDDDCSLYNELIFNTAVMASSPEHMVANIEAVVFPTDRVSWVENFARQIHRALAQNGIAVPLLEYNALVYSRTDRKAFSLVEAGTTS